VKWLFDSPEEEGNSVVEADSIIQFLSIYFLNAFIK
jgi:hypothetical protein